MWIEHCALYIYFFNCFFRSSTSSCTFSNCVFKIFISISDFARRSPFISLTNSALDWAKSYSAYYRHSHLSSPLYSFFFIIELAGLVACRLSFNDVLIAAIQYIKEGMNLLLHRRILEFVIHYSFSNAALLGSNQSNSLLNLLHRVHVVRKYIVISNMFGTSWMPFWKYWPTIIDVDKAIY